MAETRRQAIARALRDAPMAVEDIARRFGAPVKTVITDLEHIRRGLKKGERWTVREAECHSCGFSFRGRERLETPSRCPECKSENIAPPEFGIEA